MVVCVKITLCRVPLTLERRPPGLRSLPPTSMQLPIVTNDPSWFSFAEQYVSSRNHAKRADAGTRFHLRSAHQIFAVMYPEKPELLAGLSELLDRLELGLPANALPLTEITGLSRGQYLSLLQRGCRTPSDVDAIPYATLVEIVGEIGAALIRGKEEEPPALPCDASTSKSASIGKRIGN